MTKSAPFRMTKSAPFRMTEGRIRLQILHFVPLDDRRMFRMTGEVGQMS